MFKCSGILKSFKNSTYKMMEFPTRSRLAEEKAATEMHRSEILESAKGYFTKQTLQHSYFVTTNQYNAKFTNVSFGKPLN